MKFAYKNPAFAKDKLIQNHYIAIGWLELGLFKEK